MIFILDNYDSFTFNLVQAVGDLGADPVVARNDATRPEEILAARPRGIIISPGPGTPDRAGISVDLIRAAGDVPLLGVCLGHQAIGIAFGGRVVRAPELVHGKPSVVRHDGAGLFEGLPNPFSGGRYHSLMIERETCPPVLEITARTESGLIMAVRHRARPVVGVQFHPESILTPDGPRLLANFLALCGEGGPKGKEGAA
ncbi:MAG: aminodeoxychorismate/anthranilate synthase component II [Planctomycetes bacterium]|nr:aminodeoxychorismate/anthranilate synthase component II [Planctomycetota bacterium]